MNLTKLKLGKTPLDGAEQTYEVLGKIATLTELDLSCSEVVALPEQFGELTNLKDLNLSWCKSMASLSEGFGELDLKELNVRGCNALTMDVEITKIMGMKNLTNLDIGSTNISMLPERFGQLESLTKLNLQKCTSLESLSTGIGECKKLEKLILVGCSGLVSLPEGIPYVKTF